MRYLLIITALLSLTPRLATAQEPAPQAAPNLDWSATFTADTLRPHLRSAERVLVLGAGSAAASDVATRLVSSLQSAGASLVMNGSALGDLSALNDEQLLARAAAMPVDAIWIVRVFPGAQPDQSSAIILVYDRDGAKLRYAVQALPAQTLPAPPAAAVTSSSGLDERAKQGVSSKAETTPEVATAPKSPRAPSTAESRAKNVNTYKANLLVVEEIRAFAPDGSALKSTDMPYQSIDRKKITWPQFYKIVGRDDMAKSYEANEDNYLFMTVFGSVLSVVGAVMLSSIPFALDESDDSVAPLIVGGGVLFTGGLVLLSVGLASNPAVATPSDHRRMAREYNESLRRSLDLEEEDSDTMSYKLSLTPNLLTPGLNLTLQF